MSIDAASGVVPGWTLGWRMQRALSYADLTTIQVAEAMGVSRTTVSRWLNDAATPKRAFLIQLSLMTRVSLEWLETGKVPRPDGPDGGLEECAIRDSNPKPAAWEDTALTSSVARRTGTVSRFPVRPAAA